MTRGVPANPPGLCEVCRAILDQLAKVSEFHDVDKVSIDCPNTGCPGVHP